MTNKSLSEQICEICGIKPYYGIYVNFGDLDNDYRLVTNKRKYRLIADCRYDVDDEDDLRNLEPKYLPNFQTNNNNFVKLWELPLNCDPNKYNSLGELLYYLELDIWDRKTVLEGLLCVIQYHYIMFWGKDFSKDKVEIIKQIIRQADWEV